MIENVLDESHDFSYCRQRADENEKKTGNKTVVKHLGTRMSGLTVHQHFIVKTGNKTVVKHLGTRMSGLTEHQHFIVVELLGGVNEL